MKCLNSWQECNLESEGVRVMPSKPVRPSVRRTAHALRVTIAVPPPLEESMRHKIPQWLKERIRQMHPAEVGDWDDAELEVFHRFADRRPGEDTWLDHWGTATYAGEEYLISEPYTMGKEAVTGLTEFCKNLKLKYSIQAAGSHRPNETLRVMVFPEEWNNQDTFLQEPAGYGMEGTGNDHGFGPDSDEWSRTLRSVRRPRKAATSDPS